MRDVLWSCPIALLMIACSPSVNMGSACPPGMPNCTPVAGSGGASGASGYGGHGGVGGITVIDGGDGRLTALIQEQPSGLSVTMVTITCAGECKQVLAVATGGNPPYTFAWNDGIATAAREICADDTATFEVTVNDTASTGPEFRYDAQTATAQVTANVLTCPDDAGGDAAVDVGSCGADASVALSDEITPDILGNLPSHFLGGANLPPGRYRITYVDGCVVYSPFNPVAWKLNGADDFEYWIIGATTADLIQKAPGNRNTYFGFDNCVAGNIDSPPVDLDFAGGKLGIYLNDYLPSDNVGGPEGRDPTWRLTRICP